MGSRRYCTSSKTVVGRVCNAAPTQHTNGALHVTTVTFRVDSAHRGASILALPAKAATQIPGAPRRVSQASQRRTSTKTAGDDDQYRAAREEEAACASTALFLPAHKMPHVHLDAELNEPPPPTHAHNTQRQPPPRQRVSSSYSHSRLPHSHPSLSQADGLLEDRVGAGVDAKIETTALILMIDSASRDELSVLQHLLVAHTVAASVRMPPSCGSVHRPHPRRPGSDEHPADQCRVRSHADNPPPPAHSHPMPLATGDSRAAPTPRLKHTAETISTTSNSRARYSVNSRRVALPGVHRTRPHH
ncbi:hypothetical protein B0H16DRAFT_1888676 [Mycena metata]|uniref:Uncharacterized protein n=1 Tax=Mycena metata TaxID=1033252 RepID=A0AAD7IPM2_9AGAR|nr:hypothetical protein B0H16DRAFT_1888676 [Mycena metata]